MPAASTHAGSFPTGAERLLSVSIWLWGAGGGQGIYWEGEKKEMLKTKNTQKSVCVFKKKKSQPAPQ